MFSAGRRHLTSLLYFRGIVLSRTDIRRLGSTLSKLYFLILTLDVFVVFSRSYTFSYWLWLLSASIENCLSILCLPDTLPILRVLLA